MPTRACFHRAGSRTSKFKNREIQFMRALSENLDLRNLDNDARVFHFLLDAVEEEVTATSHWGQAATQYTRAGTTPRALYGLSESVVEPSLCSPEPLASIGRQLEATRARGRRGGPARR
jgi:hypothetical protein